MADPWREAMRRQNEDSAEFYAEGRSIRNRPLEYKPAPTAGARYIAQRDAEIARRDRMLIPPVQGLLPNMFGVVVTLGLALFIAYTIFLYWDANISNTCWDCSVYNTITNWIAHKGVIVP